jgi:methionine synthase II (cobalamin-independent)
MADLGRRLMEEFEEAADLHLVPNGDLRSLPREVAREKVLRLGAAARMLRGG